VALHFVRKIYVCMGWQAAVRLQLRMDFQMLCTSCKSLLLWTHGYLSLYEYIWNAVNLRSRQGALSMYVAPGRGFSERGPTLIVSSLWSQQTETPVPLVVAGTYVRLRQMKFVSFTHLSWHYNVMEIALSTGVRLHLLFTFKTQ
jgi:hypothetical protein